MNLRELQEVTSFIVTEITNSSILTIATQFKTAIEQSNQNRELMPNAIAMRESFVQAHYRIDEHVQEVSAGWSYTQKKNFAELGASRYMGENAASLASKLDLSSNTASLAQPSQFTTDYLKNISLLNTNSQQIANSLKALLGKPSPVEQEKGAVTPSIMLQIIFTGEVDVKSFDQLEDGVHEWKLILHHFSILADEPQNNHEIYSTESGSLILTSAAGAATIKLVLSAVKELLNIVRQVLEMRTTLLEQDKIVEDTRKTRSETLLLKLQAAREAQKLAIEAVEEEGIKSSAAEFLKNLSDNPEAEPEVKSANDKFHQKLYEFLSKGGEVDVAGSNTELVMQKRDELRESKKKVRRMKTNLKKQVELLSPAQPEDGSKQPEPPTPAVG